VTRVLVVSFSQLASDPRVDRQVTALRTRHEIAAAGFGPPRQRVDEFVEIPVPRRTRLGKVKGVIHLILRRYEDAYWEHPSYVATFELLQKVRANAVIANDLTALPIALRLNKPVVFDAHEYAPAQHAEKLWWRLLIAPYARWQSRHYIPQVASMTTVGKAISEQYERETGVRSAVVTNAPPSADLEPSPVHDPVRILHHGGAQSGRGLEEMIRVAELLDDRFTVDFVLVPTVPGYREKLIRRARGNPRIGFPPPQPMHLLVQMANDYDIGLFLLPPVTLQRLYALPNKFFEFIQARLAVAVGPSPEMARLVRQYQCGVVADDFEPETIAAALNALDDGSIASFKRASHAAASELSAERSAELVLNAVDEALAQGK
jgi:glycosyltransferase involved in cell wall biosynthesis